MLGWEIVADGVTILPSEAAGFPLRFLPSSARKTGSNQIRRPEPMTPLAAVEDAVDALPSGLSLPRATMGHVVPGTASDLSRTHRFTHRNERQGSSNGATSLALSTGECAGQRQLLTTDANHRQGRPGKAGARGSSPLTGSLIWAYPSSPGWS
jgi:hypothetical protein